MYEPDPSTGQMLKPVRPEPPHSVLTAVKLMYAGAVVNGLALIIGLATIGSLRSALHRADPSLTTTQLHDFEAFYLTLSVVTGLIGIGLWILMAVMNRRRPRRGRTVAEGA